ncbi:MAG: phosphate ABC transporter permease [Planctomycetales bacterium 4484_113]|nr:MAG: phosphate ABC transporter permease [Planctomycetales bacterium 4484_113]
MRSSISLGERITISHRRIQIADALEKIGSGLLFLVTSLSVLAVLFIFIFIIREALPFFRQEGFKEFFTSTRWFPSAAEPEFGALALFFGSGIVTFGATLFAAPLGIAVALFLSDVVPFSVRQTLKPIVEVLAAIPSVVYGFFALVVFAPLLQDHGGAFLGVGVGIIVAPAGMILSMIGADLLSGLMPSTVQRTARIALMALFTLSIASVTFLLCRAAAGIEVVSGTNALNVAVILGIMAIPTVVSVSEDSLAAVGRSLREASYSLGATRAETLLKVVLPAAGSGILAAVILGVMRAAGETMVVWMASGNASRIPAPFYDVLEPIRTVTATIAGDMGEADQVTGAARYSVLFALALILLLFVFISNLVSQWLAQRVALKTKPRPVADRRG